MFDHTQLPQRPKPEDELRERFKITCRKCGGENIAINFEPSRHGANTGWPGGIQIGCNDCKQNDWQAEV